MTDKSSLYIRTRNLLHPGFSSCSKCGANWGWKKWISHSTSSTSSLFLFCIDCDKVATPEERWKALDAWKRLCKSQLISLHLSEEQLEEHTQILDQTEFLDFPRTKQES